MIMKNFHTHTVYCDGADTPEEMVLSAIEQGLTAIGFSGHSYTNFDDSYCIKKDMVDEYIAVVNSLKQKYASKIRIYCGLENDYYSVELNKKLDYTIGAVHYIKVGDEYFSVDNTAELQLKTVQEHFGGSFTGYYQKYFETVANVINKTHADFIAHFDLVTKFNENDCLFSTKTPEYINAWKAAADKLIKNGVPFEINTGAIARKRRTTPYPSIQIAEYITSNGGKLILNSDCHNKNKLLCSFDEVTKNYSRFGICDFEDILLSK